MPSKRKRSSAKKRKGPSSLLIEETFKPGLDPDDRPISSRAHKKRRHDTLATVRPPPFLKINLHTIIREVGIRWFAGLALSEKDRVEIEAEGKAGAASGGLSFDATAQLISFVHNNVHLTAEAGYSMLIDIILLHIASTMHGQQKVDIIPNIPAEATFETDYGNRSFRGVIDYLLSCVPDVALIIIRADKNDIYDSIIKAPLVAASYCNRHNLSGLRGCITTGEKWWFFVYKGPKTLGDGPIKAEGEYYFSNVFKLGKDLRNLPLILCLLGDWVANDVNCVQKYFENVSTLSQKIMPSQYPGKRASVPTAEDTNHLETSLEGFNSANVAEHLRSTMPTPSFSKIDMDTLAKVGICFDVGLVLSEDKRGEIEAEGKADAAASGLSFDAIVQLIKVVCSRLMTEAGRRMLISIILLRVASTVHDEARTLNIVPGFPVEATSEMASDNYSFSGVIDYLLVRLPPPGSKCLFGLPADAGVLDALRNTFGNEAVTGAVIRAEQDNMEQAIPQAALTVASHCKELELSVMRGCITSGEQWTFFVYKSPKFHFSRRLNLGENLENLALVLGLLRDLANNALEHNQKYFSYEKRV